MGRHLLFVLIVVSVVYCDGVGNYFVSESSGSSSNPGTEYFPFQSISDAISAAKNDEVYVMNIHLFPGIYQGNLNIGLFYNIPTRISSINNAQTQGKSVEFKCDSSSGSTGFITNSAFNLDGNLIETQVSCDTGISFRNGNITVTNVYFDDISVGIFGLDTNNIYINNCTFQAEESDTAGVAVYGNENIDAMAEIIHSNFDGCGLIVRKFTNGYIKSTTFGNMETTVKDSPMFINNGTWILSDVIVSNSTAAGNGGALSIFYVENVLIGQSKFENCISQENGGAIFVDVAESVGIQDSIFLNNKASSSGGAICVQSSEIALKEVAFEQNSAAYGGGLALLSRVIEADVNDIYCKNNEATTPGNCIACCYPINYYENCDIFLANYGSIITDNPDDVTCHVVDQ